MKFSFVLNFQKYVGAKEFQRRFIERMVDHPDFVTLRPDRSSGYAAQIAPFYWEEAKVDGRSPEDCADEDMSYWGS